MEYLLTSEKFEGKILFKYSSNGLIQAFEFQGQPAEDQVNWLFAHFPWHIEGLKAKCFAGVKFIQVEPDLSFEHFWDKWGKGENKKQAERAWLKLNKGDKILALENIPKYLHKLSLNPSREKMYAATYLNPKNRRFEEY